MSDDLTVMGIAATAAAAMGREQIVLAHQAEHPLAGNPDVATDPKPSPDLAVALALPGRCLQVGRSPPAAPGPRSRASVPDAPACSAGRSWRHAPGGADPPQAVGQTRAGRGGGLSPRPDEGLRLGAVPPAWSTLRSASWRYPVPPAPDRPCVAASIPPIAFSRHCSSRATPNWRDRSCTGSSPPQRPHACAPPSIAGHQQQLSSQNYRSCSGPPWTLRLSCVQGNRVRLTGGNPRRGILGLDTTRGDRLFISLLGSAYKFLAWLAIMGTPLWGAFAIAVVYMICVFRWV